MNSLTKSKLCDFGLATLVLVWLGLAAAAPPETVGPEAQGGALEIAARVFNLAFLAVLAVLLCIRAPPLRKAPGLWPRLAGAAGFLAPLLCLALPPVPMSDAGRILAMTATILGSMASIATCLWLGRSFSVLPQARGLVTSGPYRYVRHPLYLAETISIFGLVVGYERPWSLLVMLIAVAVQFPRMQFEEEVLREAFPAYVMYCQRTARLIPGLY